MYDTDRSQTRIPQFAYQLQMLMLHPRRHWSLQKGPGGIEPLMGALSLSYIIF